MTPTLKTMISAAFQDALRHRDTDRDLGNYLVVLITQSLHLHWVELLHPAASDAILQHSELDKPCSNPASLSTKSKSGQPPNNNLRMSRDHHGVIQAYCETVSGQIASASPLELAELTLLNWVNSPSTLEIERCEQLKTQIAARSLE